MAETSSIEWTDATWNPITGCSVVSPGCTNCYAMKLAGTRLQHHPSRAGLTVDTKAGPVWTGEVRFNEAWLDQPLRWRRSRRIFVCAHGDLFHESVTDEMIDQVFAIMALAPHHTFQVLTKRSARMRAYMADRAGKLARFMIDEYLLKAPDAPAKGRSLHLAWPVKSVGDIDAPDDVTMAQWPLPNVWLGISAEDQPRFEERWSDLQATSAAVRYISFEPLIGPILATAERLAGLHWAIIGGESGPDARPLHPDWARLILKSCEDAGAAVFFKQWGAWAPCRSNDGDWPTDAGAFIRLTYEGRRADSGWPMQRVGKKHAGRLLDGVEHNAMPEAR